MRIFRQAFLIATLASLVGCAAVKPAHAQFTGYVGLQTTTPQLVFPAGTSCNGTLKSADISNIGQSDHIFFFTISGVAGSPNPTVRIMGSNDAATTATNFFQMSDDGIGNLNVNIQASLRASGAVAHIQIWVLNGGAGCTITGIYMGSQVTSANSPGALDQTAYRKQLFNGVADNVTQTYSGLFPPYANAAGFVILTPHGQFPAGSTVTLTADSGTVFQTLPVNSTTSATQIFAINNFPASTLTVTYSSGGASANFFDLLYVFEKPGNASIFPLCENRKIINTAAAGPTSIIPTVIGAQIRICSLNVSSGTAEAIDFQQGTGVNCATGNSQLTGLTYLAANGPWIQHFPGGGLVALPGNAVCIHLSGANQTDGTITYSQY